MVERHPLSVSRLAVLVSVFESILYLFCISGGLMSLLMNRMERVMYGV